MKRVMRKIYYWVQRIRMRVFNPTVKYMSGCQISSRSTFEGKNSIGENTKFDGSIGRGSYIGGGCNISAIIGRYSCIGFNVSTISSTHPVEQFVSINPMFFSTSKQNGYTYTDKQVFQEMIYADDDMHSVVIGNDVWIGSNVILMGGIRIEDGAIIASGSVVTKDVNKYEIVGGVPAKRIRMRFNTDQINFLIHDKWWMKEESFLYENVKAFGNIEDYMKLIKDKNKEI